MQTAGGAAVAPTGVRGRAALVALAVVALDQLTKAAVVAALPIGGSRSVIGDILEITHVRNEGAAFGLFQGLGAFLGLFALIGIAVFAVVVMRKPPPLTAFGAALVAAGAAGNLLDRIFRGSVVDFVDLRFWWSFNVADAAIFVGACLLLFAGFKEGQDVGDRG